MAPNYLSFIGFRAIVRDLVIWQGVAIFVELCASSLYQRLACTYNDLRLVAMGNFFLDLRLEGFAVKTILLVALMSTGCVTNPETGRRELLLFPDPYMNALGAQSYQEALAQGKLSNNAKIVDEVRRIGMRIAEASGAKFNWEINVIEDSKTVNAFCLPGGKIAVYTGIIPVAKNNAGLAAVLGHEVGHAVARHGAERMTQGLFAQTGLIAIDQVMANSKYRSEAMAALGIGAQVGIILPFSRKHESEADTMGLKYMARAGFNPEEAVKLWERMARLGGSAPEVLSTHPDPSRRAKALQEQLSEVMAVYSKSQKQEIRDL